MEDPDDMRATLFGQRDPWNQPTGTNDSGSICGPASSPLIAWD